MIELLLGGPVSADGALRFSTPEPWIGAAAFVAVAAFALVATHGGAARPRLRAVELLLWALSLGLLVFGLAGPQWVEPAGRPEPGRLVVLVDGSASMGVAGAGGPRAEAALRRLSEVTSLADDGPVDVFTFSDELVSGAPARFTGRGTDLGAALAAVADRYLGQQLRGVVVITDGIDRGSLRRSLREAAEAGPLSPTLAPSLPGPLTLLAVGEPVGVADTAVDEIITGGFAFQRTPFTLTARLRGAPGATLPVSLLREGRPVSTRPVTLDEEGRGAADFAITPREVGRAAWEVSVPVAAGDPVPGNNSHQAVIRVVRDHVRVLQVSGSPSPDTQFMRLFLKGDPSVDLVSFFILRTHEDMGAGWGTDELSLIQFPYERLFAEDLSSFDLVILQNFDYGPYFEGAGDELLGNLATYVTDGHALVMTGGDRSFDLGDYANTPLASVLPVKLGLAGELVDEAPFRPLLTDAGAAHPITRLGPSPDESRAVWARLPEMDGMNLTAGLVPGAAALAVHPSRRLADGSAAPVLAVREVGKGRTMALMVDASWRWSFSEAALGRGNQAYLRFWKGALRWLVADPDDQPVVVSPAQENVMLGDEVRLVVRVRDAGYGPVEGAEVTGAVYTPDGGQTPFALVTDGAGEALFSFPTAQRGAHRVKVEGRTSRGLEGGQTVFAVSDRDPELDEIAPDAAFLSTLARLYGDRGRFVGPDAAVDPLLDEVATRLVAEQRRLPLHSSPLLGLLIGLLASGAWWARRRSGGR